MSVFAFCESFFLLCLTHRGGWRAPGRILVLCRRQNASLGPCYWFSCASFFAPLRSCFSQSIFQRRCRWAAQSNSLALRLNEPALGSPERTNLPKMRPLRTAGNSSVTKQKSKRKSIRVQMHSSMFIDNNQNLILAMGSYQEMNYL